MLEMFYKEFIDLKDAVAKPEKINHKFTVLNNSFKLYDNLTKEYKKDYDREPKYDKNNNCKQKYGPKDLRNLKYQYVKLLHELKQLMELKQLQPDKIPKHVWVKLSNKDYISSIKDATNNLDDNNYRTIMNRHTYDLRNSEKRFFGNNFQKN